MALSKHKPIPELRQLFKLVSPKQTLSSAEKVRRYREKKKQEGTYELEKAKVMAISMNKCFSYTVFMLILYSTQYNILWFYF